MKDVIYIAGKLTDQTDKYLQNVYEMEHYAEMVRRCGASVINPAYDLIRGLIHGDLSYEDYWQNNVEIMLRADAVALTGNWRSSKGAKKEIAIAKENNIPVLEYSEDVERFIDRPKILCIVGESGTGKTTIADYIEKEFGIEMIRSYTDRPMRHAAEDGHTFLSKEEFDQIKVEDMTAHTQWGEYRYCCCHKDVQKNNTYIIDERGYSMLRHKFKDRYNVKGLRLHRNRAKRINDVGLPRVERDEGKFVLHNQEFQWTVSNNGTFEALKGSIKPIIKEFFNWNIR